MDALARGPGNRENYPAHKTWFEETLSKVQGRSPTAAVGVQPLWSWDPFWRRQQPPASTLGWGLQ